ncbi:UNVERIFIED_CONTAM: hypothetical protein K2H54_006095 [Gekko kuhli]
MERFFCRISLYKFLLAWGEVRTLPWTWAGLTQLDSPDPAGGSASLKEVLCLAHSHPPASPQGQLCRKPTCLEDCPICNMEDSKACFKAPLGSRIKLPGHVTPTVNPE